MTAGTTALSPARRSTLARRAQLLAAASVTYNLLEAVIAIAPSEGAQGTSHARAPSTARDVLRRAAGVW